MKSLARHHPRAAIAATLSAIGYAGKQGVLEVIEGATKAGAPSDNASGELVSNYLLDEEQKKELLSTVGPDDLRRLADLADVEKSDARK
jgi:hypothetical protein